ncbi:MAG: hypothetical protein K0S76_2239 [Herbinix sp.]|jgi:hypothetical protein|nr:hypothetical protein [Herbinix sp.]
MTGSLNVCILFPNKIQVVKVSSSTIEIKNYAKISVNENNNHLSM